MNIERVRTVLGVWAPMAIGGFIIATSINFYVTARLSADLESWRLVCSAGAFFVGGVLLLSTYGRYMKTKEARRGAAVPTTSVPSPTTTPRESADDGREGDNQNR
ncbi:MAG TPA: hypothetical protein VEM77_10330 [Thermoplasmata archaeon]|nr:hypothetical protein [Thermoplasmata archaeon]